MIASRNPATGEVLAELPSASAECVDRAVAAARVLSGVMGRTDAERGEIARAMEARLNRG